jgi:hypothetical protein
MVHALEEIRQVLVPDGLLIDLRPVAGRWPVEVVTGSTRREIGRLVDLPVGLADDTAANNSFKEIARRRSFSRENKLSFRFFYYWDTPDEMRDHIREKWGDFMELEEASFSATQSAWEAAEADRRVRVRLKMLLTSWRKR